LPERVPGAHVAGNDGSRTWDGRIREFVTDEVIRFVQPKSDTLHSLTKNLFSDKLIAVFSEEKGRRLRIKKWRRAHRFLTLLFVLTTMCVILPSCAAGASFEDEKVTVAGEVYDVMDDTTSQSDSCHSENGVAIMLAGAEELIRDSSHPECQNDKIAMTYLEAAEIAIPLLNSVYEAWTETGGVVVEINKNANAWIVSGQLESRESTFGGIGVIAFSIDTGKVLFVGMGIPFT
jgi:hypothetical protein